MADKRNKCKCQPRMSLSCKHCSRVKMWWSDPATHDQMAWYSSWNDEYSKNENQIATAMYTRWKKKYGFSFIPRFYHNQEPGKPEFNPIK